MSAVRRIFHRIGKDIDQHLLKLLPVPRDIRHDSRIFSGKFMRMIFRFNAHHVVKMIQKCGRRKRLDLPRDPLVVEPRKHEQVGYDARHPVALLDRHAEKIIPQLRIKRRIFEHGFHGALDAGQRRAQLMGNVRDKFPPGLVQLIPVCDVVDHAHDAGFFLVDLDISELRKRDIKRLPVKYDVMHDVIAAFLIFVRNLFIIDLQFFDHAGKGELPVAGGIVLSAKMKQLSCGLVDVDQLSGAVECQDRVVQI